MDDNDNITRSNDPKLVATRLFIGNVTADRCTKQELIEKFQLCGRVLGASIHKGYAFVQMDSEIGVMRAVQDYDKTSFKGQVIEVKPKEPALGFDGGSLTTRKRPFEDDGPLPLPFRPDHRWDPPMHQDFGPLGPPPGGPFSRPPFPPGPGNMMGPPYVGGGMPPGGGGGGPPYMDEPPFYGASQPPLNIPPPFSSGHVTNGAGPGPGGPPPFGHEQFRDGPPPGHQTPIMPPPHVPPMDEGVQNSGGGTGGAPKRIEYGVERPFDAVIVVTHKNLKHYAEMVERRLLELNMVVDMIFLLNEKALNKAIDDMTCRGVLYIIVIQQQHQEHKSITANIMHGTPQEHRNMPIEDALVMLARDFNGYLSSLRCGSEQPTMGFLLNLLADGKHLSVAELDRIITHLQDRRDRLIEAEGGRKEIATSNPNNSVALQQKILNIVSSALLNSGISTSTAAGATSSSTSSTSLSTSQQLNVLPSFNPQVGSAPLPPTTALASMVQQYGINLNKAPPGLGQQGQQQQQYAENNGNVANPKAPGLNLMDPNLMKNINNLLQNPNLFKSMSNQQQMQQQQQQQQNPNPQYQQLNPAPMMMPPQGMLPQQLQPQPPAIGVASPQRPPPVIRPLMSQQQQQQFGGPRDY